MNAKPVSVFLIDENKGLEDALRQCLGQVSDSRYLIKRSDDGADIEEGAFDICVLGSMFADHLEIIDRLAEIDSAMPVALFLENDDHAVDRDAMSRGAVDVFTVSDIVPEILDRVLRHGVERKKMEVKLRHSEERYKELAEYATATLHNVGNLLTSLVVSSQQVAETLHDSAVGKLERAVDLFETHEHHLGEWLTQDKKGQILPKFLQGISRALMEERDENVQELEEILKKLKLMQELIQTQHSSAKGMGVEEALDLNEVVEDVVKVKSNAFSRHEVRVEKNLTKNLIVKISKAKLTHVLINLFKNAIEAMDDATERLLSLHSGISKETRRPFLEIRDTGGGIERHVISRLFHHGFTTKKEGHGFGLYYCWKTMDEAGGEIRVSSDGAGKGSVFRLSFPAPTPGDEAI